MRNFQLIPKLTGMQALLRRALRYYIIKSYVSANFAQSRRNGLTLNQQGSKAPNPISKARNF